MASHPAEHSELHAGFAQEDSRTQAALLRLAIGIAEAEEEQSAAPMTDSVLDAEGLALKCLTLSTVVESYHCPGRGSQLHCHTAHLKILPKLHGFLFRNSGFCS